MSETSTHAQGNDLILTRRYDASPEKVFRALTEPELLRRWFAPAPFQVTHAEIDLRVGGANRFVMRGPDGSEFPMGGTYLEVIPGRLLVTTDAYTSGWEPSAKPFMTTIQTLEAKDGGTLYTAVVRHWSEADRVAHERMGFHEGWPVCAEQMAEVVAEL